MNAFACLPAVRHRRFWLRFATLLCCGPFRGLDWCQAGKTSVVKSDSRRGSWTREFVGEERGEEEEKVPEWIR